MIESVLQEAQRYVHGNRAADYGHPLDNHSTTAEMVSAFLARKYGIRVPLVAEDIAVFNILQKVSREANAPKRDTAVDIAGYAENLQMIRDERERRREDRDEVPSDFDNCDHESPLRVTFRDEDAA